MFLTCIKVSKLGDVSNPNVHNVYLRKFWNSWVNHFYVFDQVSKDFVVLNVIIKCLLSNKWNIWITFQDFHAFIFKFKTISFFLGCIIFMYIICVCFPISVFQKYKKNYLTRICFQMIYVMLFNFLTLNNSNIWVMFNFQMIPLK